MSDPFEKSDYYLVINEPFDSSLTNWNTNGDVSGVNQGGGDYAMEMADGVAESTAEWSGTQPEFIGGDVSFEYDFSLSLGDTLRLEVYENRGAGYNWYSIWSRTSGTGSVSSLDLSIYHTDDPTVGLC